MTPTGTQRVAGEVDLAEAHTVVETNLVGAWRFVQAALPLLRRSRDARILNASSGMGQRAEMGDGSGADRISKAALNALTRVVAAEELGIRINSICPGWVRTDLRAKSVNGAVRRKR